MQVVSTEEGKTIVVTRRADRTGFDWEVSEPPGVILSTGSKDSEGNPFTNPTAAENAARDWIKRQTEPEAVVEQLTEETVEEVKVEEVPKSGKLPDDFPGYKALDEAGIHTYKQLNKYAEDYTEVPGIGPKLAEKITEALS